MIAERMRIGSMYPTIPEAVWRTKTTDDGQCFGEKTTGDQTPLTTQDHGIFKLDNSQC